MDSENEKTGTLIMDIGGTKTLLAVSRNPDPDHLTFDHYQRFDSVEYSSFSDIIMEVKKPEIGPIGSAVVAVAGPVIDNTCRTTNLPWVVEPGPLKNLLDIDRTIIMNDLEAAGYEISRLSGDDLDVVKEGVQESSGNIGIISPGTGLGESFVTWTGNGVRSFPTEGSHVEFGPTSPIQVELLQYMMGKYHHVSYERICSGIGLPEVYNYLREKANSPSVLKEDRSIDPNPQIVKAAREGDITAGSAVRLWVSILGSEAGNLALKVKATGGIFITGGMAPHMQDFIRESDFKDNFESKGRMTDLMRRIPVFLVKDEDVVMKGASRYARNVLAPD